MENKHSTDGIAEDLIRSSVQIASAEMHVKTLIEKRNSELQNGMVKEENINEHLDIISDLEDDVIELAEIRREDMLYLFELYGSKGDKEQWCMVKHLGIAMMTAFEGWQASDRDPDLQTMFLRKNKLFLKSMSKFLGVSVTECAACFADILKGEMDNGTTDNLRL